MAYKPTANEDTFLPLDTLVTVSENPSVFHFSSNSTCQYSDHFDCDIPYKQALREGLKPCEVCFVERFFPGFEEEIEKDREFVRQGQQRNL